MKIDVNKEIVEHIRHLAELYMDNGFDQHPGMSEDEKKMLIGEIMLKAHSVADHLYVTERGAFGKDWSYYIGPNFTLTVGSAVVLKNEQSEKTHQFTEAEAGQICQVLQILHSANLETEDEKLG